MEVELKILAATVSFAGAVSVGMPAFAYDRTVLDGFLYSNGSFTLVGPAVSYYSQPTAINDDGVVVGGGASGYIYSNGAYTNLQPGYGATAINDAGAVVGYYHDSSGQQGFIYSGGTYTKVDVPGSIDTVISGINDTGIVAGYYYTPGSGPMGFIDSSGTYTTTVNPPGSSKYNDVTILGINNAGAVDGFYINDGYTYEGFIDSNGTYTNINPPGSNYTLVTTGINNSGEVAGFYINGLRQGYGFRYSGGTYSNLNLGVSPVAINDSGTIIAGDEIIDSDGTVTNVNVPAGVGARRGYGPSPNTYLTGINNAGAVIGYFVVPVPEPATWAMMLVGFGAVGFALRRKTPSRSGHTKMDCTPWVMRHEK